MQSSDIFFLGIKVVAFDFDQTLVDESFSIRYRWHKTLEKFSYLHSNIEKTFFSIFDIKGSTYKKHLDDTLRELRLPESHVAPMVDYFRTTISGEESPYPYASEVIHLLKQRGFHVGIITDGRKDYQENRIKNAGLNELCDFVYYGDEYQKPDTKFFYSCIEKEHILPHEFLYVGDNLIKDIQGALAVGSRACYLSSESSAILSQDVIRFNTMHNFYKWLKQK